MKRLLLSLLAIFFIGNYTPAQNLNNAAHAAIDRTGGMISIHSKNYYVETIKSICCQDRIFVTGIDSLGNKLFSTELTYTGADYLRRIIRTADKHILVLGSTQPACDVGSIRDFIAKIDTNGTVIYKKLVSDYGYTSISDIAELQDSTILMTKDSLIIRHSKDGDYLNTSVVSMANIQTAFLMSSGNVLLNGTWNNVSVNGIYSPFLDSLVSVQNSNYTISKFSQTSAGGIVALASDGEVLAYDNNLNYLTQASSLSSASLVATDFVTRNDSVFVTGVFSVDQKPFYSVLHTNLTQVYLVLSNYKHINPTGITLSNKNRINILTTGSSSVSKAVTFKGLFQFGINGNFNSSVDMGVTAVSGMNSFVTGTGSSTFLMPDLTITVKNYGTDTIKSFYLNHYMPGYQLCFNLFHKLCTIPVAPNETISIQTGTFTIHTFFSVPPGTPHGSTTELNMCFFTTVPNSMIDIETSNDAKCESVLFTVTSIDEDNVSLPRISVSPNPFSSSLSLRSEILIENITLYNISGQQIQYVQPHAKEYSLNQSNLDPGIYFLHVQTDAGRVIKKVIKE